MLQLVQYHSCNWSSLAVVIGLHADSAPRFRLIFAQLQLDRLQLQLVRIEMQPGLVQWHCFESSRKLQRVKTVAISSVKLQLVQYHSCN
jgi:hypothetical protein